MACPQATTATKGTNGHQNAALPLTQCETPGYNGKTIITAEINYQEYYAEVVRRRHAQLVESVLWCADVEV